MLSKVEAEDYSEVNASFSDLKIDYRRVLVLFTAVLALEKLFYALGNVDTGARVPTLVETCLVVLLMEVSG